MLCAIMEGLDMSSVIRATGKKECAEFTRRAANADRIDPHEQMDIDADRVEQINAPRDASGSVAPGDDSDSVEMVA